MTMAPVLSWLPTYYLSVEESAYQQDLVGVEANLNLRTDENGREEESRAELRERERERERERRERAEVLDVRRRVRQAWFAAGAADASTALLGE
ncbi:hypothetical protein Mapa_010525 [Marchantia paleacea]|nr:hypothetical protein Mapa_010525 [Marchantia paleacea]